MVFVCISDFSRLYWFSIRFICGLLPGHSRVSMPYSSTNSLTEPHLWQGALSCMKMRYAMPENPPFPGPRIHVRNLVLIQYCFALHMALNKVQKACTKHAYDTRHHDLHVIFTRRTTWSSRRLSPDMRRKYYTCWFLHWMTLSSLITTFTVRVHLVVNQLTRLAGNPT